MDYTISNQETADKPGPGFYNRGTLSGFEEDINEDVNVKDSRKIKLTPTTKNQILTLVHEMAKSMKERVAYKVDDEVASFDSDSAAMDFKNKNSNIQTIKKL